MLKEQVAALNAKIEMKKMDVQEQVENFINSEVSANGVMQEGILMYGGIVLGVIVIALAVIAYKSGFANIFDFFQDGTTKRPTDWQ